MAADLNPFALQPAAAKTPSMKLVACLLATASLNGMEPYAWLRRVMRDLPKAKTVEEVEALLEKNSRRLFALS